jgi:hypothetical protein
MSANTLFPAKEVLRLELRTSIRRSLRFRDIQFNVEKHYFFPDESWLYGSESFEI